MRNSGHTGFNFVDQKFLFVILQIILKIGFCVYSSKKSRTANGRPYNFKSVPVMVYNNYNLFFIQYSFIKVTIKLKWNSMQGEAKK